jgi:hypothetical protein
MIVLRKQRGYPAPWHLGPGPTSCTKQAGPRLSRDWQRAPPPSRTLRAAQARWPRKNEAILDRGNARCLGMFRPGRENGIPAEPENVDCSGQSANAAATRNGGNSCVARRVQFTACGDLAAGGKIGECVIFVSQGWGSVQNYLRSLRSFAYFALSCHSNPAPKRHGPGQSAHWQK